MGTVLAEVVGYVTLVNRATSWPAVMHGLAALTVALVVAGEAGPRCARHDNGSEGAADR